jgi:hypothetical protein
MHHKVRENLLKMISKQNIYSKDGDKKSSWNGKKFTEGLDTLKK